jgi:hypothetical protein
MPAKDRIFVPHRFRIAANIASVRQTSDRAQGHSFTASGDHDRRARFLYRFWLEDRVLDMEYLPLQLARLPVHILRMSRTASSICRMRIAGRGGNSQPYWRYSSSNQPAPIPKVSRPRLIRSIPGRSRPDEPDCETRPMRRASRGGCGWSPRRAPKAPSSLR